MRKRRNKRPRKKGLSAIVTTLVIILLVIVAVGIMWVVIKNLVIEGSEGISLRGFALDLDIKSVKVEGEILSIGVERNPGKGDIVGIKFVFENGTESEIVERVADIGELDEQNFIFGLGDLSLLGIRKVSIVPIYESSGKEVSGDVIDVFDLEKPIRGEIGTWVFIGNFDKMGLAGFGSADYLVSSGGVDKLPVIERVIVDPLDVKVGDIQTFTVYVTSPNEITEVTSRTQLDNEILILPLEKTENINEYIATWQVYDTHTTTYRTNFTARDSAGNENTVTMSWTDPCSSLADHGGPKTIAGPCSVGVGGVDGIDDGNITLSTGGSITLTGGKFIRTPGFTMFFSGGSITFSGGELREAYLYYNDADGDLKGSGYDWSSGSTFSGHVRASSATSDIDCLDSDADVYQNVGSLSTDADNDGYITGSAATQCVGDSTAISGRTYYKNTTGGNSWLTDSQKLGTGDCDDGTSNIQISRTLYTDADSDGYTVIGSGVCANSATWGNSACSTGGSTYSKNSANSCVLISVLSGTDCLDSDVDVYQNIANLGLDADNDRYTTGTSATRCVGAKTSFWYKDADATDKWITTADDLGTNNDCRDACSDVHPGQIAWFTSQQCGTWDFNCDSVNTKQFPEGIVGVCESCETNEPAETCDVVTTGVVGWQVDNACGETHIRVSNSGTTCASRDIAACTGQVGCVSGSTTQGCR